MLREALPKIVTGTLPGPKAKATPGQKSYRQFLTESERLTKQLSKEAKALCSKT